METQRKSIKLIAGMIKEDPTVLDRIEPPREAIAALNAKIEALKQCDITKPLNQCKAYRDALDQRETVKRLGEMLREDPDLW